MINQEGRPIKVHANRLYRQNLPATDKRSENLPKEYQDQTQDKRRTYLPTDDSGETADIPDGEKPQESSSYYDETPTCSISSSILNRNLPPTTRQRSPTTAHQSQAYRRTALRIHKRQPPAESTASSSDEQYTEPGPTPTTRQRSPVTADQSRAHLRTALRTHKQQPPAKRTDSSSNEQHTEKGLTPTNRQRPPATANQSRACRCKTVRSYK